METFSNQVSHAKLIIYIPDTVIFKCIEIMTDQAQKFPNARIRFLLPGTLNSENMEVTIDIKTNDKSAGDIASYFQIVLQTQNCIQSLGCNLHVGSVQYLGGTEV